MTSLKIIKAADISEKEQDLDWLIENLWLNNGVGLIGGEPKSFKTFAALSVAVATASGKDCFGHYPVRRQGRVLLYAAEDSLSMVGLRLASIASAMGSNLSDLDIHVIAEPRLRIDITTDRQRLEEAIDGLKPVLLVLDPFVRLHSIDENSSGEVAKVLSWLRHLQRQFNLNVLMVHHARKRAGKERPGQSLRGSSELHAWGDSNLYLRRSQDSDSYVELTIEHRAAASQGDIRLGFHEASEGPYLLYDGEGGTQSPKLSMPERILEVMIANPKPFNGEQLRTDCSMRSSIFWQALKELISAKKIVKSPDCLYYLADQTPLNA